jgi:uncharacterized protein YbbC (DUF1343 family)
MVTLGIDVLLDGSLPWGTGQRVGLLCNQASVNHNLVHSRVLLKQQLGNDLSCLFSPQHGFYAEKQDNMIESDHIVDELTGVPVFSLYGETRRPTKEMFEHLDVLLVDIVDVGTRVYTFLYTLAYCMEAAANYGKKVVVLDRPNPIGGDIIEGNILNMEYSSFVGRYPLPMRHGLTFGELAHYINQEYGINADLAVVPMDGWKRSMYHRDTGLPWVFPSPNMPTPETAVVYPGQVLWEGTAVSEGRGTTMPFELVGAPYWVHQPIMKKLGETELPGCYLRPVVFEPTSGKQAAKQCTGFHLHVTDPQTFKPYRTSLAVLQAVYLLFPEAFAYKQPPYEYEYEKLPMDLILGDRTVREKLQQGRAVEQLEDEWSAELELFDQRRKNYFIY